MHHRRSFTVAALAVALLVTSLGVAAPASAKAPAEPLDLNRATAEDLQALPGIGPALAARIVSLREKEGRFERVEDLLKVRGIGEKSFQKLRPHVTVGKKR